MVKHSGFSLLVLTLMTASAGLAVPVFAQTVRMERQHESLEAGGSWSTSRVGVDHKGKLFGGKFVRAHAAFEHDSRPMGDARRVYVQAGLGVSPGTALEVGLGNGAGAVYSWRRAAHATVYQGWKKVELSASVARMQYIDSTLQRYSLNARMPVGLGITSIVGLSRSHTPGRVAGPVAQFGLERGIGSCTLTGNAYFGRELLAPEEPTSQLLKSKTYHVKSRCAVSAKFSVEVSVSATRAEQLSRQGASGALVFTY